jgi:hypothetical protein
MMKKLKYIYKYIFALVVILVAACVFFYFKAPRPTKTEWGLTYSYQEAELLGFDGKQMYWDILADLKPQKIRLMAYWEDIEKTPGKYDFSYIGWQLQEAQKSGTDVLVVIGRKEPRWPECHEPEWFSQLNMAEQDQAVLNFLKASVDNLKSYPALKEWQVENEPYFGFGIDCPTIPKEFYAKEVQTVRELDNRPIVATDSGERGSWLTIAEAKPDVLGATVYRVSYSPKFGGYYKYPVPAAFFRIKAGFLATFTSVNQVWDVELQAEPWFANGIQNTPLDTQKQLMNQKVFAENVQYAKNAGFGENYLWGVEWWYWMAKKNGDFGMWAAAKDLLNKR